MGKRQGGEVSFAARYCPNNASDFANGAPLQAPGQDGPRQPWEGMKEKCGNTNATVAIVSIRGAEALHRRSVFAQRYVMISITQRQSRNRCRNFLLQQFALRLVEFQVLAHPAQRFYLRDFPLSPLRIFGEAARPLPVFHQNPS